MRQTTSAATDVEELLLSAAIAHAVNMRPRVPDALAIAALMSNVQSHSIQSFRTLYELTSPPMLRVILRINRNRDDADEILQDVYVRAWVHAAQFDERKGSVMAWLTSMAQHGAVSSLRRRTCRLKSVADSRRGFHDDDDDSSAIPSEDLQPPASAARAHAVRAVHEGINSLPREHRLCIVLAFFNDLTHAEIAERVGRPIGTVKSWLRRSLLGMRPVLAAH